MGNPGQDVRRHVRAAREEHGWSQIGLARAARVSRGTVQNLENGLRLSEGKESRIEKALGWKIGSLDRIRNGDEPVLAEDEIVADLSPRDDYEEEVVASSLPRREKLEFIRAHRWALAEERNVLRRALEKHPEEPAQGNDASTRR